jgi:hypothetical protein
MSIKRTRPKTERRASDSESPGKSAGSTKQKKELTWQEAVADKPESAFVDYSLRGNFTPGTLLNHATFGKGIVLGVEDRKMEVLFAESKKNLAMGIVPK